jgi:DNA-binding response OmpR family regulator
MAEKIVLIVEDDASHAQTLVSIAEAEGHETRTCDDATEAVRLVQRGEVSIVLCDGMHGGWKIVFKMARVHSIAFRLVTASDEIARDAEGEGGVSIHRKPLNVTLVRSMLRTPDEESSPPES